MNPTNSQISDSENHQTSASYSPQDDDTPTILAVSSHESQAEDSSTSQNNVTFAAQSCNLQIPALQTANLQPYPNIFFFRPLNDCYHYRVNCKEISHDAVIYLLNKLLKEQNIQSSDNECVFYYHQKYNDRSYKISCEIVSPLLVNNCLNKNFLGIELQQDMEQEEHLAFTKDRKEYLEYQLTKCLSQHLLN